MRRGKAFNIGVPLQKTVKVWLALLHAGLLKDNFAEPYHISIGGIAPGQVAFILGVPGYNFIGKIHRSKVTGKPLICLTYVSFMLHY